MLMLKRSVKAVGELNMKKRLLLITIAVVCVSPSIVFADLAENSYVGTATTSFSTVNGQVVSQKGTIGPFQRAPAPTGSAPANPAPPTECAVARKRINDKNQLIENVRQDLHAGDAKG
jgi:hypothetical protein